MTSCRVLPAAERTEEPWRNGGGLTQPIIAHPAGAPSDEFLWRASIATIAAPGPFSRFAGMDRWFAVLQGSLSLTVAGEEHPMRAGEPALAFPGEAEVRARPIEGPALAFNLIARRGQAAEVVGVREGSIAVRGTTLILALEAMVVGIGDASAELARFDALLCDALPHQSVMASHPALVAWVRSPKIATQQYV